MIALIIDTETTGLIDNRLLPKDKLPEIIEFYGCISDLATGELKQDLDILIKPKRAISEEITRITGITNVMVENSLPFEAHASAIHSLVASANVIIAHNLSFDKEMIDIEFDRLSETLIWPRRRICTVEATVALKGFRLNLAGLHEHLFGEGFPEAHRAKNDVTALKRCAEELFKRGEI